MKTCTLRVRKKDFNSNLNLYEDHFLEHNVSIITRKSNQQKRKKWNKANQNNIKDMYHAGHTMAPYLNNNATSLATNSRMSLPRHRAFHVITQPHNNCASPPSLSPNYQVRGVSRA